MERKAIIDLTHAVLQAHVHEISAAYLFGSVARDMAGARSDVDLGLLYRQPPEPGLAGLGFDVAFELELKVKRPVDVVVLNSASPTSCIGCYVTEFSSSRATVGLGWSSRCARALSTSI